MGRGGKFSAYQQGVIKRYYENKDALMNQRLGDLVSELFLCKDAKAADKLWARAEKALLGAGAEPKLVKHIVGERNLEGLAETARDLF
jgi:hypothetical protein